MEHNSSGIATTAVSILSTIMAWTLKDVQIALSMAASLVAIVSGGFAIRYYIISTNKIKK